MKPVNEELLDLAQAEQRALQRLVAACLHDEATDRALSSTLDYPAWPTPFSHATAHLTPDQLVPGFAEYEQVRRATTQRAFELVKEGWPTPNDVGPDAADAAWLLVQHMDVEPARELLPLLHSSVTDSGSDPRQLALATDRHLTTLGEEQVYGTLSIVREWNRHYIYPAREASIDRERSRIGLTSLSEDAQWAFSPMMPLGPARTTPVNARRGGAKWFDDIPTEPPPSSPEAGSALAVYLAGTVRYRHHVLATRSSLPQGVVSTARWLDVDPLTRASCQVDHGLALSRSIAQMCLADVEGCDVLFAFAFDRRSAGLSVELGAALAQGKRVIWVGEPLCSFDMMAQVCVVETETEGLEVLATWQSDLGWVHAGRRGREDAPCPG